MLTNKLKLFLGGTNMNSKKHSLFLSGILFGVILTIGILFALISYVPNQTEARTISTEIISANATAKHPTKIPENNPKITKKTAPNGIGIE